MDKPMPDFHFKFMSFGYRFRDIFSPRKNILKEVGIKPRFTVLDYGCGSGSYTTTTAELVGKSGKVYALDIHPLAVQQVQKIARRKRLTNIETILSDCTTGLPDESVDVVLLYDILHGLSEPDKTIEEVHRVLKPNGILSVNDHHLKEEEIIDKMTGKGLFRLLAKGKRVYNFHKAR